MDPVKNIGQWSWKYAVVKFLAKTAFRLFYRKIFVNGRENIPEGGGLIFAANHQNALMDALAVIMTVGYQPVYLARADIFRNPIIARILTFLKIMPVYRFRDGVETMGQNEDTFKKTSAVLKSGGCIGIMPEGNHGEMKRLRLLKKGIFRIAFKASEGSGSQQDIKIVPVGIDYSNTSRLFEELVVNYGKPLSVSEYLHLYEKHPQKGINAMKDDLAGSMRPLIIDIRDELNYYKDRLLSIIGSSMVRKKFDDSNSVLPGIFEIRRMFSRVMYDYFEMNPDEAVRIRSESKKLLDLLDENRVSHEIGGDPVNTPTFFLAITRIICFPFFIAGYLLNILPWFIIHLVLKKLKDPQFISSFKYVMGFILVPLNYLLLGLLFFSFLPVIVATLLILAAPLTGYLAYNCYRKSQKIKEVIHLRDACTRNPDIEAAILEIRENIIRSLEPVILNSYKKLK
jgi:1-acyl-sn-glycerol-3-phosphate acyltransferase